MTDLLRSYVALHNEGLRTGSWEPLVALFQEDAEIVFIGVPFGPVRGPGAIRAAFALIQGIALARWRASPRWLAIVAGVRLSDIFTDWTYFAFAHDLTWFGRVALALSAPMNVVAGVLLLRLHASLSKEKKAIGHTALLVREYDEAIAFFTKALGFELV